MFNLFKSCITDFNDSDNQNTYDSNHLMEEQKTFAEPLYDINNQFDPYVQIFDNALYGKQLQNQNMPRVLEIQKTFPH